MQLYIRKMSENTAGTEFFALVHKESKQPFSNQVTEVKLRPVCKERFKCTDEFLDTEFARTRASFEARRGKASGGDKRAAVLADDSSEVLDVGGARSLLETVERYLPRRDSLFWFRVYRRVWN